MNFLNTNQCIESCLGAFLHFVHDDCLWAFAPDRVMRWSSAKWPRDEKSDLWKPIPFVWDFGSQVIIPEHWLNWLQEIVKTNAARKTRDPMLFDRRGVFKEPAEVWFRGRIEANERKIFAVRPEHIFRGENLVFGVDGADWLYLWDVSVGHFSQMKRRKDDDGHEIPWSAMDFQEQDVPFNLRFDTCPKAQDMKIDLENRSSLSFDFEVQISGIQLVERPGG